MMVGVETTFAPPPAKDQRENYNAVIQELKDKTEELEGKLDLLSQILLDEIEVGTKLKKKVPITERVEDKPNRCFWDNVVPLVTLIVTLSSVSNLSLIHI